MSRSDHDSCQQDFSLGFWEVTHCGNHAICCAQNVTVFLVPGAAWGSIDGKAAKRSQSDFRRAGIVVKGI